MLVKIEARILIFPGTDFHFPSTSVPPGTFFRLCTLPTPSLRHCTAAWQAKPVIRQPVRAVCYYVAAAAILDCTQQTVTAQAAFY